MEVEIIRKLSRESVYKLIGLLFMLCFQFVPIKSVYITKLGMQVIGVFIGTILLWSTGIVIGPSILAIVLLGYYNYMPMGEILSTWMGNPTLIMIFFLLILVGGFEYHGCTNYIARFFTNLKIIERRPWVFTFIMLLGTYLMAAFVNPWAGLFLFLPIVHGINEDIGFKKTDLYSKVMTIGIVMASMLGFPTTYYNGTVIGLNATFTELSKGKYEMPGGEYMLVGLILGLLCILAITIAIKLFVKPDVEPLKKLTIDKINNTKLKKVNPCQKIMFVGMGIFILLMVIPAISYGSRIGNFISNNIQSIAMTIVGILAIIKIDNKPVIDLPKIIGSKFSWQTYFLIGTSITLGQALTDDAVGFTKLLNAILTPLFSDMSPLIFFISILLVSTLLTNILNSAVYILIAQPIILTFANINNIDPLPILMLVTYTSLGLAAILPSASPYAAAIYAQSDYVTPKDIYKYATLYVLVSIVIILIIGVPLVLKIFN